eukprot:5336680-Pleurochrysis_carterae.AAC.3
MAGLTLIRVALLLADKRGAVGIGTGSAWLYLTARPTCGREADHGTRAYRDGIGDVAGAPRSFERFDVVREPDGESAAMGRRRARQHRAVERRYCETYRAGEERART